MTEPISPAAPEPVTPEPEADVEKQAFLERLSKESGKRKEAEKTAADLKKQFDELKAQMEERDHAGLPELERERKRAEQLEKRAAEAEAKAEEADAKLVKNARRSLVVDAAAKAGFDDPADAMRYPDLVSMDDVEDADQAERAVKRLLKLKPKLGKDEDTKLPGRVLDGGRTAGKDKAEAGDGFDPLGEAESLADGLKRFLKNRNAA